MARRPAVWSPPGPAGALDADRGQAEGPAQQRLVDPDHLQPGQGEDRLPPLQQPAPHHQVVPTRARVKP